MLVLLSRYETEVIELLYGFKFKSRSCALRSSISFMVNVQKLGLEYHQLQRYVGVYQETSMVYKNK